MKTASEIFSGAGLPAREQVSKENWYKIKEKIGNQIHGTFMGWWVSKGNPGFNDQLGVAIKTPEGVVMGVSVPDTTYMRGRLQTALVGDNVGFRYEGDKDVGKPQPAKIVKFYNPDGEARHAKGETVISTPEIVGGATTAEEEIDLDEAF